jgi:hypothetical protein
MVKNIGNAYTNTKILLDGNSFEGCTFTDCVIEFGATAPVSLVNNKLIRCRWEFVGPAAETIAFLGAVSRDVGPDGERFLLSIFRGSTFTFSGEKDKSGFSKIDVTAGVVKGS